MKYSRSVSTAVSRLTRNMAILVLCASIILSGFAPVSAATPNYTLVATHPEASAQSTSQGKTIHTLKVHKGKLYSGYGDYNANTGPVHINPFDLSTDTFAGSVLSMPTEQVDVFRELGGKLYAPLIDPSCGSICTDVYAGGDSWVVGKGPAVAHIYDMATLDGEDIWVVGSADSPTSGAHMWRSTDGGASWTVMQSDTKIPVGGYERYYWIASLNGKIYSQAASVPNAPVRSFDGTNWSTGTTEQIVPFSNTGTKVQVFAEHIITRKNGLSKFDGTTSSTITGFSGGVKDISIADDFMYVLRSNSTIARTADLENWQELGAVTSLATSIAVHEGYVYLGGTDSGIYKSNTAIPDVVPSLAFDLPTNNATVSGIMNMTASSNIELQSVSFRLENLDLGTTSNEPYTMSWDTNHIPNGEYSLHVIGGDVWGTQLSSTITITVANGIVFETPDPTVPEDPNAPPVQLPENDPDTNIKEVAGVVDGKTAFIHTPENTKLTSASVMSESSASKQDTGYSYPLGLTSFSFATTQVANRVSLTFITDLKSNEVEPRKYNPHTGEYFTVPASANPEILQTVYKGKSALQLSYTIADNGELDFNPASGEVYDPIGLAVIDKGSLASTGESLPRHFIGIAAGSAVAGLVASGLYLHRLMRHNSSQLR